MTGRTKKNKPDRWRLDEWFPCFPAPLIESYVGASDVDFRVGVTLMMLIYEQDGPLIAPERYLAGKCNLGAAAFRNAVRRLIADGKLIRTPEGGISHKHVDEVLKLRRSWMRTEETPEDSSLIPDENDIKTDAFSEEKPLPDKAAPRQKEKEKDSSCYSEEPNGSSGASAPPDVHGDQTPARPGDLWTVCAQLLEPDLPGWSQPERTRAWREARSAGVRKIKTVQKRLVNEVGAEASEALLATALEALTRQAAPGMDVLQGIASRLLRDHRKQRTEAEARAPTRYRIETENGRKYRIDKQTGERVEITAEAA